LSQIKVYVRCSDCAHCEYDEDTGDYGVIYFQGFYCESEDKNRSKYADDIYIPWNGVNHPRICPAFQQRVCRDCGTPIRLAPNDESWMHDRHESAERCPKCLAKFYDGLVEYCLEKDRAERENGTA
jgi:hypothetical protein